MESLDTSVGVRSGEEDVGYEALTHSSASFGEKTTVETESAEMESVAVNSRSTEEIVNKKMENQEGMITDIPPSTAEQNEEDRPSMEDMEVDAQCSPSDDVNKVDTESELLPSKSLGVTLSPVTQDGQEEDTNQVLNQSTSEMETEMKDEPLQDMEQVEGSVDHDKGLGSDDAEIEESIMMDATCTQDIQQHKPETRAEDLQDSAPDESPVLPPPVVISDEIEDNQPSDNAGTAADMDPILGEEESDHKDLTKEDSTSHSPTDQGADVAETEADEKHEQIDKEETIILSNYDSIEASNEPEQAGDATETPAEKASEESVIGLHVADEAVSAHVGTVGEDEESADKGSSQTTYEARPNKLLEIVDNTEDVVDKVTSIQDSEIVDNKEGGVDEVISPEDSEIILNKEAVVDEVISSQDLEIVDNKEAVVDEVISSQDSEIVDNKEGGVDDVISSQDSEIVDNKEAVVDEVMSSQDSEIVDSKEGGVDEVISSQDSEIVDNKEVVVDEVTSSQDTSSKSPIADLLGDGKTTPKGGLAEKRGKTSSKGFNLGNIVSRLKFQVESKQEEADVTEVKKETGDAVVEKTKSKRSEQKQQGKQMRAAHHAAMMLYDEDEDEENNSEDIIQETQEDGSKEMTNYATNTMDELLGLFGYDKLPENECDDLQLSTSLSQSKIPITGSVASVKQNNKQNQLQKPPQGETAFVISNVTSMAPSQKIKETDLQDALKKKTNYCSECNVVVEDDVMLVASDLTFCSQPCLDKYQNRQTLVCDYCSGMITQAATQKFVRETREGQKKFCSQPCSEEFSKRVRNCNTCGKEISKTSEGILAPVGSGGKFVVFCQQECVDNYGKKPLKQAPVVASKQDGAQPRYWAQDTSFICAVCNNYAKAKHVISLQGKLNGLCSADCFTKFKEKNQLAFSLCSQCSALCSNQKMMRSIEIEGKLHRFCSMRCFKMKLKRSMSTIACAACKKPNWAQSMIEEWNGTELVRFFCSTGCLGKRDSIPVQKAVQPAKEAVSKPPATIKTPPLVQKSLQKPQQASQTTQGNLTRLSSAGSGNKCDHCSKQQRPQYHLTMSDNSIRNFCTYGCVIAFQAQFNVPPVTLPQETLQLTCSQCKRGFSTKPLPLDFKGVVNVFCSANCMDEFKRVNSVVLECDYCHLDKILHERIYFSGQARSFCSEGCKLLFKQQFAQRLGLRCTVCDYCAQTCRSRVERMYGNHKKKFCSMACKSQYDKWLSKGAKCDGCKCTGRKLEESFMWRGEMKRVCNQHCLLLFYTQQNIPNMSTQTQSTIPAIQLTQVPPKTTTPVITNVMSLAPGQQQLTPGTPPSNIKYQQKVTPQIVTPTSAVKKCHKQTQITTAAPKQPPPPPTPIGPAPKMVKNKVTMVKPYTLTKSISCRPLTATKGTMTDAQHPLIIPVPVPIYVPVPMHMYTTPVPHPITLPVPVPVPIFIPVAYNNADRLLASIKEISEKIPSDPLEAEMLMLADAIAGDHDDGGQRAQPEEVLELNFLPPLDDADDLGSLSLDDTEDVLPSQFLADNILKMAADIAHVLDEPNTDLQDDLNALQAVEEPKVVDAPTRTTRSKSGKTSTRRGRSRGNKRACVEEPSTSDTEETPQPVKKSKQESRTTIGGNAYRFFVTQRKNSLTGKEGKNLTWNPNLLEVSTEELVYILCLMCREGQQPDGLKYSADMLHLIFLSIQHCLSDNGRPENIFTDQIYRRFTDQLHEEIKEWEISRHPLTDVILNTCIDEETLWNAKQLGAHSPYILLSTMIYFNAKHFQLKTLEQHKALAFCRIQKHIRKMGTTRNMFLRYYPADRKKVPLESGSKRKRDRESDVESVRLEQSENTDNPLRCPVRLYEFYLSKCPDSVRSHSELFYLVPERSCVPDSPVWYSSAPLGDHDMNKILTRVLMVTDVHNTWNQVNEENASD